MIVRRDALLLVRHEKLGRAYWLLPGGGVEPGEELHAALRRELLEECGLTDVVLEGPVALAESIAPPGTPGGKHVLNVLFRAEVPDGALEGVVSRDDAVTSHRLVPRRELATLDLRPPIHRFLERFRPGDPFVSLGRVWGH